LKKDTANCFPRSSDDLLDIMEHLQDLHVPMKEYFPPVLEDLWWLRNSFIYFSNGTKIIYGTLLGINCRFNRHGFERYICGPKKLINILPGL
jgi:hypothetical protein